MNEGAEDKIRTNRNVVDVADSRQGVVEGSAVGCVSLDRNCYSLAYRHYL